MSIIDVAWPVSGTGRQPGGAGQKCVSLRDSGSGGGGEVAFGYINMPDSRTRRVRVVERRLHDGPRACGWSLGEVFYEEMPRTREAFRRLQAALQQGRARHAVIASFRHFAGNRLMQNMMLGSLENDLDVDVVALDEDLPLDRASVGGIRAVPVGGRVLFDVLADQRG